MNAAVKFWRGEIPLPSAFWHWAVFGGIAVNAISSGLFLFLIMTDRPLAALIAGYAPSIPYNIFAAIGVWRAADRYEGDRRWADVAKGATVFGMVLLSLT